MYKISIIVPVYNSKEYVSFCIQSVLNQTFSDFELILVDDGSSNEAAEICEYYAAKDGRIKTIHKKNGGVSSSRNTGLEFSQGEYISFCDSDDWIEADFIKTALHECETKMVDYYISGIVKKLNNKIVESFIVSAPEYFPNSQDIEENVFIKLLKTNYISSSIAGLLKREVIGNTKFSKKLCFGEDLNFNLDILTKDIRIYTDSRIFYNYRSNDNNSTNNITFGKCQNVKTVYQILLNYRNINPNLSSDYYDFVAQRCNLDLSYVISMILYGNYSLITQYKMLKILLDDPFLSEVYEKYNGKSKFRRLFNLPKLILLNHIKSRKNDSSM